MRDRVVGDMGDGVGVGVGVGVGRVRRVAAWVGAIMLAIAPSVCDAQCGPAWERISATGPSPRTDATMVYDAVAQRMVLFGGMSGTGASTTYYGDTWSWDGVRWELLATTGPSPRAGHIGVYDPERGRFVVFGGTTPDDAGVQRLSGETWEWDGVSWEQVSLSGPSPRTNASATFDPIRRAITLFGGTDPARGAEFWQIWLWDGTDWSLVPAEGPGARRFGVMTFDAPRNVVMLFGGMSFSTPLSDTWTWDGGVWRLLTARGPTPRTSAALAFDDLRARPVLFGGLDARGRTADTWAWGGTSWVSVTTLSPPSPRSGGSMCYDPVRDRFVLFGGAAPGASDAGAVYELAWSAGPHITAQPRSSGSCRGRGVDFSIAASSSSAMSYRWEVQRAGAWSALADGPTGSGSTISGAGTATLTVSALGVLDASPAAAYRCVITDLCGSQSSAAVEVALCQADLDDGRSLGSCDGAVTVDDLLFFLEELGLGSARADLDDGTDSGRGDGAVGLEDLLFFLDRFGEGC